MSFDIFLGAFQNGECSTFSRALVEKAMEPFIESRSSGSFLLTGSLADVWISDTPEIDHFGVSRPPGRGHPFWQALLDIMRQTPTVLYWPGSGPEPQCVVADEAVIAHMPADMIKTMGRPPVVTHPDEFWDHIAASA